LNSNCKEEFLVNLQLLVVREYLGLIMSLGKR